MQHASPWSWIGAPSNVPDINAWTKYVKGLRDNLAASWADARAAYLTLKQVREKLGLPFIDDSPSIGEGGSAASHGAWTTDLDTQAQDIQAMTVFTLKVLDDVIAGKRKMQYNKALERFEIQPLSTDLIRIEQQSPSGTPIIVDATTGQPTHVTGQVAAPALVWAATFVGSALVLPAYWAVDVATKSLTDVAEQKTMQTIAERQFECVQSGKCTPEQAQALGSSVVVAAKGLREAKAEQAKQENKSTSDIADAVKTLGWVALGVAGIVLVARLIPSGGLGGGARMLPAHGLSENPDYTKYRNTYLPSWLRDTPPFTPSDTDLEIWTWEEEGKGGPRYMGIAFAGKAGKPLWYYNFRSKERRLKQIEDSIASRKSHFVRKAESAAKKKAFQHTLKPGDILYSSWGYDQTNVDFYEVLETRGKSSVSICKISKSVASSSSGADYVVPIPGSCSGKQMTKRVGEGNYVALTSYSSAHLWDGRPLYETASGWGH